MIDPNLTRIATDLARVDAAHTLDELSDLYAEIIGCHPSDDDNDTAEDVRAVLVQYLRDLQRDYGG